jgi:hypothetical protein
MWEWMHNSGWWWIGWLFMAVFWGVVIWLLVVITRRWRDDSARDVR